MTSPQIASLTPSSERLIRRASTFAVSFVALAAAVLSFSGLHELAVRSGFPEYLAFLFPLATDVAVGAFSLAVLHHRMVGLRAWWPWICMMLGVAVSVAGNVWAAPEDLVSRLVHAWPPIIFALSFETLTRLVRHRIHVLGDEAPVPGETAPASITTVNPAPSVAPVAAVEQAKDAPPVAPSAVTETAPTPAPAATVPSKVENPAARAAENVTPAPKPAEKKTDTPASAKQAEKKRAGTLREQITEILAENPDITASAIARELGKDRSYVSKIVREIKDEGQAQPARTAQPEATPATPQPTAPVAPAPAAPEHQPVADEAPLTRRALREQDTSTTPTVNFPALGEDESPFEVAPPALVLVREAKAKVFETAGRNPERAAAAWNALDLPGDPDATVTQAQLDQVLTNLTRNLEAVA